MGLANSGLWGVLRVLLRLEETKAGCPHLAPPPARGGDT